MSYDALAALARAAARRFSPPAGLPAFFAVTDPQRTRDPVELARRLPAGSGLVLRHFGQADLIGLAGPLARIARARKLVFLIANDPYLARRAGAHGVHWPEANAHHARIWQRRRPDWIMTASAHDRDAAVRPAPGIDAVFVSPVFDSASASAGAALGPDRVRRWAEAGDTPVYALGGVHAGTLDQLDRGVFSGVCAVSARAARS